MVPAHTLAAASVVSFDELMPDGFDERWAAWQERGRRQDASMLRGVRTLGWCAGAAVAVYLVWVQM